LPGATTKLILIIPAILVSGEISATFGIPFLIMFYWLSLLTG
jgi:NhaP-type Na+/H+ and K+/H+ antiporter